MKALFLWLSRNRWLGRQLTRTWLLRRAVLRFVPGERAADALDACAGVAADGRASLVTYLGENVTDRQSALGVTEHYLGVLRKIQARELPSEISVKVTQLGYDIDPNLAAAQVRELAMAAKPSGRYVWIDIEGSAYVDGTVELYRNLQPDHPNLGLALQAYLHRTADDVRALLPLEPAIRLVKGAYREPASIAYQDKRSVDANYAALAALLYSGLRGRGRVALGSHDVVLIEQAVGIAGACGVTREQVEVQMLYGIRAADQARLASTGLDVRTLVSYGEAWYAWYMRRLAERPANAFLALRQIVGI